MTMAYICYGNDYEFHTMLRNIHMKIALLLRIALRLLFLKEREERLKAEDINKELKERAKSLELSAKETAEGSNVNA